MAISDDTAALVAAQLTVAWAVRKGSREPAHIVGGTPDPSVEDEVLSKYSHFRTRVGESKLRFTE